MQNARIDFAPDSASLERFLGTYEHPLYGTIAIRVDAKKGAVLDVGEWASAVGILRAEDGSEKLVTTTALWAYWPEFVPKEQGGRITLEPEDGQRTVVFERVSDGK